MKTTRTVSLAKDEMVLLGILVQARLQMLIYGLLKQDKSNMVKAVEISNVATNFHLTAMALTWTASDTVRAYRNFTEDSLEEIKRMLIQMQGQPFPGFNPLTFEKVRARTLKAVEKGLSTSLDATLPTFNPPKEAVLA